MAYGFNDDKSKAEVAVTSATVGTGTVTTIGMLSGMVWKYGNVAPESAGLNNGDIYFYFPDMP